MSATRRARRFAFATGCAALLGLVPAVFNVVVDPFEMAPAVDLKLDKARVSEKAHYPLWKLLHEPEGGAALYVLGDSRMRALRDKLWREAGRADSYNFAYGGATIPEVHSTFELLKTRPGLKTLVVGVQLRSFDLDFKDGMNRVPEAIAIGADSLSYYTNWFVARIGWRLLGERYEETFGQLNALIPEIVTTAQAANLTPPQACAGCKLPPSAETAVVEQSLLIEAARGPNLGLGRGDDFIGWAHLWSRREIARELPKIHARQVRKNAASDWRSFTFSNRLWARIAEIADWAAANDVELIFVIPPTITEMQQSISAFGHDRLDQDLRLNLADLAPVVDFDFDNAVTRGVGNFTDAYHFGPEIAREIVGELTRLIAKVPSATAEGAIRCPLTTLETTRRVSDGAVEMIEGEACRIWRSVDVQ